MVEPSMNDTSALVVSPVPALAISVAEAEMNMENFRNFVHNQMIEGEDYGVIPGTGDKRTLLKPGAEKLCWIFGLTIESSIIHRIEEWDGDPVLLVYESETRLTDRATGHLIATGNGSCNSREVKYRYRSGGRECPSCGMPNIRRSKPRTDADEPGWYCWAKTGGCSENFAATDRRIVKQKTGRRENPDIAEQANTILKMAHKRSLVDATLKATRGSGIFSQDQDADMGSDTSNEEHESPPESAEPTTQEQPKASKRKSRPKAPAKTGNGNEKAGPNLVAMLHAEAGAADVGMADIANELDGKIDNDSIRAWIVDHDYARDADAITALVTKVRADVAGS